MERGKPNNCTMSRYLAQSQHWLGLLANTCFSMLAAADRKRRFLSGKTCTGNRAGEPHRPETSPETFFRLPNGGQWQAVSDLAQETPIHRRFRYRECPP